MILFLFTTLLIMIEHNTQVAKTYTNELETINAEPDLDSARKILEKGTKVNFKAVEDLAEVWCEWSEMELHHG